MGAFRKSADRSCHPALNHGSVHVNDTDVMIVKEVKSKDSAFSHKVVEFKRVNVKEYSESLDLPNSDEYRLEDMMKAGYAPDKVNVSGMLDDPDPTASDNVGLDTEMFSKLVDMTPQPTPEPTPESTPEPSNVE